MKDPLSRRKFLQAAAAGAAVVGFDLRERSWVTQARAQVRSFQGVPKLDGVLLFDEASREAIAVDHSNLFHRVPAAVLRPGSAQDIVKIVQYANQRSLKVVMKGRGHSQYGQTQAENGIVIDSGNLNNIQLGPEGVDAQPGAFWANVATVTLAKGLTPPVFPATCLALSVGGTLSVGGIGMTTIHHGAQVDTVTELDVVTGNGRLVTCSSDRESELFNMVLAGIGQCGIIVRARVRLIPAPSHVALQNFIYSDLERYLTDQSRAATDGRFDSQRGVLSKNKDGKWIFTMEVGKFYSSSAEPNLASLQSGLRFDSAAAPVRMTYKEFLFRFEVDNAANVATLLPQQERQFLTMWMPASTTRDYLSYLFSKVVSFNRLSAYPMNTSRFTRPLFRVPDEKQAFAVWLFHASPRGNPEARSKVMASNRDLLAKMTALGGKRYAPYTGVMSPADWQEHFGPEVWRRLSAAKKKYDPNNVLTPGPNMFA